MNDFKNLLKGRTVHRSLVVSPEMDATLKAISTLDCVSTSKIINEALNEWLKHYQPTDRKDFEKERERILKRRNAK